MHHSPIHIGTDAREALQAFLAQASYSRLLVLVDSNARIHCYPRLQTYLPEHSLCEVPAGELNKTLTTCEQIWQHMTEVSLDRRSLVLNLGGGVIGDMGGFAASTYKRGVAFVQIPTTLLSQVDASVGGKLGIDFQGFKNHIGLFREPGGVYIDPGFLQTLPARELHSGFAEIIKHHLIADGAAWQELQQLGDLAEVEWTSLIQHSVAIKSRIVEADPYERGLRKALNFGHTIGHAIESHFLESDQALLHGEAIAIGMVTESFLSLEAGLIAKQEYEEIVAFFEKYYAKVSLPEAIFPDLFDRMKNDKKNEAGHILCTLLDGIGQAKVNQRITQPQVEAALRAYG